MDLFQPSLIVSSEVFQVNFIHLVYNTALFLSSFFRLYSPEERRFEDNKNVLPITGNIKQK